MKRKPKNKGRQTIKIGKRTKIMQKEEIDALFSKDQEGSKRKESSQKICQNKPLKQQTSNSNKVENKTQKETSINIFTEGISYEKIDHNKYNNLLTNFNFLLPKSSNKNINQKKAEKSEKKEQISKKYLCERALYKEIEIEIKLIQNKKSIEEIMSLLNDFFIFKNNFIYYEYSNSRNISFNKLSEGDMLAYRYFYKNYDNLNIDNNLYSSKEEYIKQLDYVNTLNNLFFKYNIDKKLFYIITPLYAYSFDYNKNIPLLITSSRGLESQLSKRGIKLIKFKNKKNSEKQNKNSINKSLIEKENNETRNNIDNNDKNDKSEDDEEELEINNTGVPIGISQLYVGHFFNFFLNDNALKPFNIFSDFEFEGSIFRKCKTHLIKAKKNSENKTYESIIIKIEGIIFEENILNIIDFFKNKVNINNYCIRLNKIESTCNFYKENKEIESSFERIEFKDNNFYFYKQ